MRDLLIGYLLGALDEPEHDYVEQRLRFDATWQAELLRVRRQLEPLRYADGLYEPPGDLARRTCRAVLAPDGLSARASDAPSNVVAPPQSPRPRIGLADAIVAACVVLVAGVLFLPALAGSRHQARLSVCQDNLRHLGQALSQFSSRNGQFPEIPNETKVSVAGVYAPTLLQSGLITEQRRFLCPESELAQQRGGQFCVPSVAEVVRAEGERLRRLQQQMGGSYGYNLGVVVGGRYRPARDRGRTHFALMADAPSGTLPRRVSANHAAAGQNVLFECGRVQFLTVSRPAGSRDDMFVNDRGLVEAGLHVDDAVIGASAAQPLPTAW